MVFILIWVIVGGYRTFYGAMLGAVVLSVLDEFLRGVNQLRPAIYGITLIFFILYLSGGPERLPQKIGGVFRMRKRGNT